MTWTKDYTISTAFPNGIVASDRLLVELQQAGLVTALDYATGPITTDGDVCTIYFAAELSGAEQIQVDNVVAEHSGESLAPTPSLLRICNGDGTTTAALTDEGEIKVVPEPPGGVEKYFYSPNLCDPCSWYEGSQEQTQVAMTSSDQQTWDSGHTDWIDLYNGRIFGEFLLRDSYPIVVEVLPDGESVWVEKTMNSLGSDDDGDFGIAPAAGQVIFNSPLAAGDQVRATFHKANGFNWSVVAGEGEWIKLLYVEIQWEKDIQMVGDMQVQTWAYNPEDPPNKIELLQDRLDFRRLRDFFIESTGPYPVQPAFGGDNVRAMQNDLLTAPFHYMIRKDVKFSTGAEIKLVMPSGQAFTGTFANATFYCRIESE